MKQMQTEGLGDTVQERVEEFADALKPRLRGWFHQGFTPVILLAGLVLVAFGRTASIRFASAIYLVSALLLFGNSAFYHRGNWTPKVKAVFRRVDHANIFVFIAGTYTPLSVAMLHGRSLVQILVLIWTCALVGVLFRVFWIDAPRWLYVGLYVAMGWAAVGWMSQFLEAGGAGVVALIAAGGLVYTVGALAYAFKYPNPWPEWFGFHEIFHICTIIAAICHFIAICLVAF